MVCMAMTATVKESRRGNGERIQRVGADTSAGRRRRRRLASQGPTCSRGTCGGTERPTGQAERAPNIAEAIGRAPPERSRVVSDADSSSYPFPQQTPLFHAEQADRYERQRLIESYEQLFGCRLIVFVDAIFAESITYMEELVYDADPSENLHLLLNSPGGDPETAVRLVRSLQARCHELTVVVPDQAKSAATILTLGAHHVLMGPTSDLGPVDPQFIRQGGLVSAKDLIAAVEHAEAAVAANPSTYPLHASLLSDVTEIMLQQARSALERTRDIVREALLSNPDRTDDQVEALIEQLAEPLIDHPKTHGAIFGAADAKAAGLDVNQADPRADQWKLVWLLWARYFNLHSLGCGIYEGRRASRIIRPNP